MSAAQALLQPPFRRCWLRRVLTEAGIDRCSAVILAIWSLTPVYNMLLIALDPEEGEIEFAGNIWPPEPSLEGFRNAVMQQARYLWDFWHQFGNSLYIAVATMLLTLLTGSLASFAVGRMRLARARCSPTPPSSLTQSPRPS